MLISIALLLHVQFAFGEFFVNVNKEDPCNAHCENAHLSFGKVEYIKSCCYRGCRFFRLVESENSFSNRTKSACKSSCDEAYENLYERFACYNGCDYMSRNRIDDFISLCSNGVYTEESLDLNLLLMLPDMPEPDILSDPGLRKELLPGWWYYTGFKLPQTFVKTLPRNSKVFDYGIFPDYTSEIEKSSSSKFEWLQEWKFGFLMIIFNIIVLVVWYLLRKLRANDKKLESILIDDQKTELKKDPNLLVES